MSNLPPLDAEETTIAWLNTILPNGYVAYGDKPKGANLPAKYVLVDRTGGPRIAMVMDSAQILIEVYNKDSRLDAKNVAMSIADQVPNMVLLSDNLVHASVNSVVNLDDVIGQFHRYQVYCDIHARR